MVKHLDISVRGQVQGVFFRAYAQEEAEKLSLSGYVGNQDDGTVRIEVEGEEKDLDVFLKWVERGPEGARVDEVHIKECDLQSLKGFDIRY